MSKPIKIILLVSETIFRKAIAMLLKQGGMEVMDDLNSIVPLLSKCLNNYSQADLVLMDYTFFSTLEKKQMLELYAFYPQLKTCVIVPDGISQFQLNNINRNGVTFFLYGSLATDQFIASLQLNFDRSKNSIHTSFIDSSNTSSDFIYNVNSSVTLSTRELEIIRLSCLEYNSKEIASQLYISKRTVDQHRMRIMERIGKKNFIGVVLYAVKHNVLNVNEI